MKTGETRDIIRKSAENLSAWVRGQHYTGWDIYDGLNSQVLRKIKNPYIQILMLQANKYSPINFRPALKIEKGIDLKAMALFAQAYASLYISTGEKGYLTEMQKAIGFISGKSLKKKYGFDCWASHYYPYANTDRTSLSGETPDIIGTRHAIFALCASYAITGRAEEKQIALSATEFLTKELFCNDPALPFFRYSKSENEDSHIILNASSQAIDAIATMFKIEQNAHLLAICEETARMLITTQNANGSWDYSLNRDGSTRRVQQDFHQGNILDGLVTFLPYSDQKPQLAACIQKGARYYKDVMFRKDGRSFFRYPLPYPIDIHNQAQGIISFSKLRTLDSEYLIFAEKICLWTINNMQDRSGYFYYQKWPLFKNKIPYIRWNQAWMMFALATILEKSNGEP